MSETNKLTTPFPEVCNFVNSTQAELANLSDAVGEQITVQTNTLLDGCEYTETNVCDDWSTLCDWIEQTDAGTPTPADVASLVALIQEIRTSNTNLLERTIELEQVLLQNQAELQVQTARSHNAESILGEKLETLADCQKQVNSLSNQLETAHQTIQRQQASIKNLTTQIATSSERIAQMERECSLTQANYNEKFHQLMQSENSCRELRSRLVRQQRYTMQLKVALEKSLDSPRGYQSGDNSDFFGHAQSVFPQAQPITPWSVATPSFSNELEPSLTGSNGGQTYFDCTSSTTSVEQTFVFTKDLDADREDANWQDLFNLLDGTDTETNDSELDFFIANAISTPDSENLAQSDKQLDEPYSNSISQPVATQTDRIQPQDLSKPTTIPSQVNPNWPSPLVYPLRPPKGRKSLSSIELPKFNQKRK